MDPDNQLKLDRVARLEQASIDAAHEGLKSMLLLNGGSCVAVLGFLATVIKDTNATGFDALTRGMMYSLLWFATGAGLAVFASLLSYLTNQAYVSAMLNPKISWQRGGRYNLWGTITSLASLGAFAAGVCCIAKAAFL